MRTLKRTNLMGDQTFVIDARFRGPPESANGGYVGGLLGGLLGDSARVTLRRPTPLGRPLHARLAGEGVELVHDGALVAEGVRNGLRIFPGPVPGRDLVAAPWDPGPELANGAGTIRPEFVWAALDCPGAFATGFPGTPMVVGRLAARVDRSARVGEPCVVIGWSERSEGRKHFAAPPCSVRTASPWRRRGPPGSTSDGRPLSAERALPVLRGATPRARRPHDSGPRT